MDLVPEVVVSESVFGILVVKGEEGRMAEKTILRRRIQAQKIEILNRVHAR